MKDIPKLDSSSERVKSRSTTAKWHLYNCITPRLQLIINNKDAKHADPLFKISTYFYSQTSVINCMPCAINTY